MRRPLLIGVTLLGTLPVQAATAAGSPEVHKDQHGAFHIEFTTPGIFDLSSDWVEHDDQGRLSGAVIDTDGADFQVVNEISGSCKISRGVTTVKQRIVTKGVIGGGDEINAVSNYKGTMVGDGGTVKLVGISQTRACVRLIIPFVKKKFTACTNSVDDRTYDHNGDWAIRLAFDNVGNQLIGTATIYLEGKLPSTKSYEASVTGKLDPDGEANFKLKPIADNGLGGTIKLRALVIPGTGGTPPELVEVLEIGGKILGQKFDVVY